MIEDRTIYHGGTDGNLRSVDAVTGNVNWTWELKRGGTLGEPVVTPAGVMVASSAGGLFLIDRDSGKQKWKLEPEYRISGVTAGIAVDGRQVVITTNAGNLMSLIVPQQEPDLTSGMLKGLGQR